MEHVNFKNIELLLQVFAEIFHDTS